MKKIIVLGFVFVFSVLSCAKKEETYPPEPRIYYESALPHEINVFDTLAKTTIQFKFEDGDGDLGVQRNDTLLAIFVRDSRDTSAEGSTYEFPFPYIPGAVRNGKALVGTASLEMGFQFYKMWDSLHYAIGRDTMTWEVYIKDMKGNKSNTITTDTIYVEYRQ